MLNYIPIFDLMQTGRLIHLLLSNRKHLLGGREVFEWIFAIGIGVKALAVVITALVNNTSCCIEEIYMMVIAIREAK